MITDWLETSRNVIDKKVREELYNAYILGRKDGYNKGIDDFNKEIKMFVRNNGTIPNHCNSDLMAEKMKLIEEMRHIPPQSKE